MWLRKDTEYVCVHAHVIVLLSRVKDLRRSFLEDVVSK